MTFWFEIWKRNLLNTKNFSCHNPKLIVKRKVIFSALQGRKFIILPDVTSSLTDLSFLFFAISLSGYFISINCVFCFKKGSTNVPAELMQLNFLLQKCLALVLLLLLLNFWTTTGTPDLCDLKLGNSILTQI